MTLTPHRTLALLAVVGLALALSGCSSQTNERDDVAPTSISGAPDDTVVIADMAFAPAELVVPAGMTVTWVWDDGTIPHDVTFDDGPASPLQETGTWSRTFDQPGTHPYICSIHPQMTGTVVVR
jgi:plastocyanin